MLRPLAPGGEVTRRHYTRSSIEHLKRSAEVVAAFLLARKNARLPTYVRP